MRAVVLGGIGHLGPSLVDLLRELGHEVVVAARRESERKKPLIAAYLQKRGARLALFPRLEEGVLAELGGDVYFYLVGKFTGSLQEFREGNVTLLEETARAAARSGARVVYLSSVAAVVGIKGLRPGSTVYEEEEHLSMERDPKSFYEVTKAEGERALVRMGKELKGRWSILRPGIFLGPWGHHAIWRYSRRSLFLRLAPFFGVGLPVVDVRDVAEVLVEAGEGKYDGKWLHVVSPYYPDVGDLIMEGCRYLKRSCVALPLSPIGKAVIALSPLAASLAPKGSALSLALSWLRFRYKFASRVLKREWRDVKDMVWGLLEWQDWAARAGAAAGI
ncbi:MAG: NAD(P)-dependent oxidoreductase [Acidilobaceae archaeon]|nr:NAD(P)-dependent oxidoreductase [Acidilobaceae archaeon]MCX8165331.1 NAD(P)-dependent oxidoreductase [Acidilobaceae archaeon]MDW7973757.1 NAD(P)-dependent oxidoreductase [Sulfolobales archaeon]